MSDRVMLSQRLLVAGDVKAAVAEHLAFLAETAQCRALLAELMERFVDVKAADDGSASIVFEGRDGDRCAIAFAAPYTGEVPATVPPSVVDLIRVHNGVEWEAGGGGYFGFGGVNEYGFDGSGGWEARCLLDAAEDNAVFLAALGATGLDADDVEGCFDFGQNWLIWHPGEKNTRGEHPVYFVSHDDCEAQPVPGVRDLGFGALTLRVIGWDLLDDRSISPAYT